MQLQEGRLWVRVWAPPGQFGVGVPGAEVIDLGCEFLLETGRRATRAFLAGRASR